MLVYNVHMHGIDQERCEVSTKLVHCVLTVWLAAPNVASAMPLGTAAQQHTNGRAPYAVCVEAEHAQKGKPMAGGGHTALRSSTRVLIWRDQDALCAPELCEV